MPESGSAHRCALARANFSDWLHHRSMVGITPESLSLIRKAVALGVGASYHRSMHAHRRIGMVTAASSVLAESEGALR